MTNNAFTPERIAQLREMLAATCRQCGALATTNAHFQSGTIELFCDSCVQNNEAIADDIDAHEMQNFSGAYGLVPRPAYTPIAAVNTLPAALDEIEAQSAALTLANARIARLEEALKFYSDVGDYTAPQTSYVYGGENKLWCDCGGTARRALKEGA